MKMLINTISRKEWYSCLTRPVKAMALSLAAVVLTGCGGPGSLASNARVSDADNDQVVVIGDSIFALSGKLQDILEASAGETFRRYTLSWAELDGGAIATSIVDQYAIAREIWADERSELARKQQEVQSILAELDNANHLGLNETLYQLITSLSETFEGPYQHLIDDSSMVTKIFFSLGSVQRQLQRMPPEERQNQIDEVRRQLGYSESQIDRLRQRDELKITAGQRENPTWPSARNS